MAAADAKMEPVKGLDEGDANEVLSLKSQEGEVFRTSNRPRCRSLLICGWPAAVSGCTDRSIGRNMWLICCVTYRGAEEDLHDVRACEGASRIHLLRFASPRLAASLRATRFIFVVRRGAHACVVAVAVVFPQTMSEGGQL